MAKAAVKFKFSPDEILPKHRAWSYSRWKLYTTCPFKFMMEVIKGQRPEQNQAMQRGQVQHELAEGFVKGALDEVPDQLANFKPQFTELRKQKAKGEDEWAFTREWRPTDWFGSDVYCRIKTDAHACIEVKKTKIKLLRIIDYKSGQLRDYTDQMSLYALGGFKMYADVDLVRVEIWFTDRTLVVPREYEPSQEVFLQRQWEGRVRRLQSDTRFDPTPGKHCSWCPHSKAKGGPCKF